MLSSYSCSCYSISYINKSVSLIQHRFFLLFDGKFNHLFADTISQSEKIKLQVNERDMMSDVKILLEILLCIPADQQEFCMDSKALADHVKVQSDSNIMLILKPAYEMEVKVTLPGGGITTIATVSEETIHSCL